MMSKNAGNGSRQTAVAQHTSTAAETTFTTVTATLAGGAIGRPLVIYASGSISGIVQFQFGANATYALSIAPNQLPVKYVIPKSAFPNRTGQVPIQFECSGGVGTLIAIVEFETD